jgi:hypothetical protein
VELYLLMAGKVLEDLPHSDPAVGRLAHLVGDYPAGPYVSPTTLRIRKAERRFRLLGRSK